MVELLGVERLVALLMRVVLIDFRIVKLVGVWTVPQLLVPNVVRVALTPNVYAIKVIGVAEVHNIGLHRLLNVLHVVLENTQRRNKHGPGPLP
jgi:hypothetical protein